MKAGGGAEGAGEGGLSDFRLEGLAEGGSSRSPSWMLSGESDSYADQERRDKYSGSMCKINDNHKKYGRDL